MPKPGQLISITISELLLESVDKIDNGWKTTYDTKFLFREDVVMFLTSFKRNHYNGYLVKYIILLNGKTWMTAGWQSEENMSKWWNIKNI